MPGFADDITRLIPHMRRFARALVRGHSVQFADDLVQETVVLAMRAERLARGPELTNWCFSTLMRVHRLRDCATALHGEAQASEVAAQGGFNGRVPAAVSFLPKDIARLDHLSIDEREVLLLATLVGMSYSQIAVTLHVTLDAVMIRLDQARHHLARSTRSGAARAGSQGSTKQGRPANHLRLVK
ncbi:MAG TPA: RNA polymerase sigma factor [Lichenihabitans sp.]|jgi:RNA polymerase sigma-70 factor (ECF subfamily)|nr:RNA polymerase sigma factor [Lichenihabitans sp.]